MEFNILVYLAIGCGAGFIGSMVGLGGGIIVVPALTILMNIDIRQAISASLISLVATSVMSVSVFSRSQLIHFKFGLILSLATILGSFLGSIAAIYTSQSILMILFSVILFISVYALYKNNQNGEPDLQPTNEDVLLRRNFFSMDGYYINGQGERIYYRIKHPANGISLSGIAGIISGMLGVGGGVLQVPVMSLICGIPLKVATATSSFIIGYTGLAGGLVYFVFGNIDPVLTSALILGILSGAYTGAKTAVKLQTKMIARILNVVLIVSAIRMLLKALGI
jgi:uncharacterized protein